MLLKTNEVKQKFLLLIVLLNSTFIVGELHYRYSRYRPKLNENDRKLIQIQNQKRIQNALREAQHNPGMVSSLGFSKVKRITWETNNLDLTQPDALDNLPRFTKNNLHRYRVNREILYEIQNIVLYLRAKTVVICESSSNAVLETKTKIKKLIGKSFFKRRSYIVTDSKNRPEINFSDSDSF